MTIRKQWITALVAIAITTVIINSVLSTVLVNRNFNKYMEKNYEDNVLKIVNTVEDALSTKNVSRNQMKMTLKGYLDDPIVGISVYDNSGNEIIEVGGGMMHHMMMMEPREDIDSYDLKVQNKVQGKLYIMRYSKINASNTTKIFKQTVLSNSIVVSIIAIIIAIIVSIYMSKKTIKDLQNAEKLAQDIDLGNNINFSLSKVKEIRFIQESLTDLNSKLKLKQKARKQLLDEMVHQTRTPLTILKTHIEGYQDGVIKMNDDELKVCEEQIDNVTSIISNMRHLIESEKEKEELKIESLDLNQLINQIGNGLRVQFNKKNIDFKIEGESNLTVKTDRYKLSQSIYNLITNSYKFTPSGGEVSVKFFREGTKVKIEILDTGIGIKKENLERIFNPYFRGENALDIKGEGIGLYIVRENIEDLGGEINVESEYGKGSKFNIRI